MNIYIGEEEIRGIIFEHLIRQLDNNALNHIKQEELEFRATPNGGITVTTDVSILDDD